MSYTFKLSFLQSADTSFNVSTVIQEATTGTMDYCTGLFFFVDTASEYLFHAVNTEKHSMDEYLSCPQIVCPARHKSCSVTQLLVSGKWVRFRRNWMYIVWKPSTVSASIHCFLQINSSCDHCEYSLCKKNKKQNKAPQYSYTLTNISTLHYTTLFFSMDTTETKLVLQPDGKKKYDGKTHLLITFHWAHRGRVNLSVQAIHSALTKLRHILCSCARRNQWGWDFGLQIRLSEILGAS